MVKNNNKKIGAVLVQGGGIAGVQASLDLANCGFKVYLVEREAAIGGMMSRLDKTFPTGDCATCIISPKLVECARNLNVEILTLSELVDLKGEPGNFKATVKTFPRYVDQHECTACGDCIKNCPVKYEIYPIREEAINVHLETDEQVKVDAILDQYQDKDGVLIPLLKEINKEFNYLPENILRYASGKMGIPLSLTYRIATFYNSFSLVPKGRHIINVCAGTTCYVRGANKLLDRLSSGLNVGVGETTEDKRFTLETVRCLGCCSLAPVMSIDGEIYGKLKGREIEEILQQYE